MTAETAQRWGSALDAVVVYAQGALCRRLARGSVPPDGRVRVTGLPRSLDPGSLRARVTGARAARVVEARVEVEAEPLGDAGSDTLRREVERLRDEWAAAQGRRDRQRGLVEEVGALRPVPPARRREDPHRRTPVDAWLGLAEFVDERLTGLHARLVELEKALERAEHAFLLASDRLDRASTDAPPAQVRTTVSAVLTFDVRVGPTADAEAETQAEDGRRGGGRGGGGGRVHGAGRRVGAGLPAQPAARATAAAAWCCGPPSPSAPARTGPACASRLATADLRRRTDLPRLRSMRIGRRQPSPAPSGWREPPTGLADLFAGYDGAGARTDGTGAHAPGSVTVGGGFPVAAGPPTGYGAPPSVPLPGSAYPEAFTGGSADLSAPPRSRPGPGGARQRMGGMAPAAPAAMASAPSGRAAGPPPPAPAAPGSAAPKRAAPPAAGPPQPSGAELDYPALVLSGPDEQGGRRGRLFPDAPYDPVAAEYRRRAEAVAALPLPGHAVPPRVSAGSFDHRFDAVARADIPSDGAWHTVTVGEIPVALRTEYLCVPSVEQTVYGDAGALPLHRPGAAGRPGGGRRRRRLPADRRPAHARPGRCVPGGARPGRGHPGHPSHHDARVDLGAAQLHHGARSPRPRGAGQPPCRTGHRGGPRTGPRHLRRGRAHRGTGRLVGAPRRRRRPSTTPPAPASGGWTCPPAAPPPSTAATRSASRPPRPWPAATAGADTAHVHGTGADPSPRHRRHLSGGPRPRRTQPPSSPWRRGSSGCAWARSARWPSTARCTPN